MTDFARLVMVSDTTGLRNARTELNHLTKTGDRTERRLTTATQRMSAGFRSVAVRVAGMVAAFAGIGAIARGSQEITQITNGLRAMGLSTQEAEDALNDIADVARRTRAPLKETAELYRRVSVAGKDLGASQADVLRFTENVGLALAASGTSSQEASGALLQLSQAMAGGVVRAEEFNSILEGAFPIAQAAANAIDGAAGSVGKLRQMVVDGQVSSSEFFEAILSQTTEMEAAFARTVPTVAQAMTVLATSVGLAASGFDTAVGASEFLSTSIIGVAQGIDAAAASMGAAKAAVDDFLSSISPFGGEVDSLRVLIAGTATVVTGMYVPAFLRAAWATGAWAASLVTLRGALMATGIGAIVVGAGVLIDFLIRLRRATGSWGDALSALGDLASGVWEGIKTSASAIPPGLAAVWGQVRSGFYAMIGDLASAWADFVGGMTSAFTDSVESFDPVTGERRTFDSPFKGFFDGAKSSAEAFAQEMRDVSNTEALAADAMGAISGARVTAGFDRAREAAARLNEIIGESDDATSEAAEEAKKLNDELNNLSKDGAGSAKDSMRELEKEASRAARAQENWARNMAGHFDGLITGGKKFSDVLQSMARQLESSAWQALFSGLGGNIFGGGGGGGFLSSLFSFDGGGYTGSGSRTGGVDGKGGFPALLHPQETVIDHTRGQSAPQAAPRAEIIVRSEPGTVVEIARQEAVTVTREGLSGYDRQLPGRVKQINRDPRRK